MKWGIMVAAAAFISSMALADKIGYYSCESKDAEDWVVQVRLNSGTADFWDNDTWIELSSALSASLCPATQKFSKVDPDTGEKLEFRFDMMTKSGTLFITSREGSAKHYAFQCKLIDE